MNLMCYLFCTVNTFLICRFIQVGQHNTVVTVYHFIPLADFDMKKIIIDIVTPNCNVFNVFDHKALFPLNVVKTLIIKFHYY